MKIVVSSSASGVANQIPGLPSLENTDLNRLTLIDIAQI